MKTLLFVPIAFAVAACAAGSSVTTVQPLADTADAPYDNVLVISLFDSFDFRRYLEKEIVREMKERGVTAVASTSMMDSRTPVTRQTFLKMVEHRESDAVLVTQLVSAESRGKLKDMNPEATYNFRPTYYYNVWSVELDEYVEPQTLNLKNTLVLATQLYSVANRESVWGIELKSKFARDFDQGPDYSIIVDEAKAITSQLSRAGLIAR